MDKVKVKRDEILTIIRENRETHNVIYTEAVKGYWDTVGETLNKELEKLEKRDQAPGYLNGVHVNVSYPSNYEKEYNQAIRMLELSIEEELELTKQEFAQYVMNEWSWKGAFIGSNTGYITGSHVASGAMLKF